MLILSGTNIKLFQVLTIDIIKIKEEVRWELRT
jgi:hypothetical protein